MGLSQNFAGNIQGLDKQVNHSFLPFSLEIEFILFTNRII